jgi:hypothetical protein
MARGIKTGGRRKGTPNRESPITRAFLRAFIQQTEGKALECWEAITDPGLKFKLWLQAAEFVYPRLGRQELSGPEGAPISLVIQEDKG